MVHRSRLFLFLALLSIAMEVFTAGAFARSSGITGRSITGCTCHGSSSGVVTFSMAGPTYLPANTQGTYTLTINNGDGTAMGIDMTVSAGTLGLVTTTNLQLASNEISHTARLTNRNITFTVTAPSSGTSFTIYYSAVAGFNDWSSGSTSTPLPIQLSSFTVQIIPENFAKLEWTTVSELNNFGFRIQRRADKDQQFADLPGVFIAGHGTTTVAQKYTFTDETAGAGTWAYRLNQIDLDGSNHFSDPVSVSILTGVAETTPQTMALMQNYPNPFNPSTVISYQLSVPSDVRLTVYDLLGREVAALVNERQQAGVHRVKFDAAGLVSGAYFYKIQAGDFVETRRLMLLK